MLVKAERSSCEVLHCPIGLTRNSVGRLASAQALIAFCPERFHAVGYCSIWVTAMDHGAPPGVNFSACCFVNAPVAGSMA